MSLLEGKYSETSSKVQKKNDSFEVSVLHRLALDKAHEKKIDELEKAISRLTLPHSYHALVLLENSISMPAFLYTLRTSNCHDHPQLLTFDEIFRSGLAAILNVDFDGTHWLQASTPVRN